MTKMIIKRDGRTKQFDAQRIRGAIDSAAKDYYGANYCFVDQSLINLCVRNIVSRIDILDTDSIPVETIQDIVVDELRRFDVGLSDCYNYYREQRNIYRNSKNELVDAVSGLLDFTNQEVLTENANKQAQLVSTQRDLMAGEVSKYISKTKLIPQHLIKAHENGEIKIHDLDYYLNSTYNCELINLDDMLQNGTVINKKQIEKPKSLRTAMTIVTQIAAQVASCTYGGQTVTLSHIAPFVKISKEKITKKYKDMGLPISKEHLDILIEKELQDEIKDSVQTFNYQVSTLMTTNGQSPFISVCMYISENPEY
jgi:ribonucleoside-triphosphate reductase